jgi:hypothetical protein
MKIDISIPPPAVGGIALLVAAVGVDALLQIPPEQLIGNARARLHPAPSPGDLAAAVRWLALHPAGSLADKLLTRDTKAALLRYGQQLETLERRRRDYSRLSDPLLADPLAAAPPST